MLEDKVIAPSLESFSFSKEAFELNASNFPAVTYADEADDDYPDDDHTTMPMTADFNPDTGDTGDVQDFFVGDQAVGDDYGATYEFGQDDPQGLDESGNPSGGGNVQQHRRTDAFEPFDPKQVPNERDLILAMTEAGANGSSLDYFDQTFLKNWAGPEHWKLRKVIRRRQYSVYCCSDQF